MAKSRTKALKPTWEGHLKLSLSNARRTFIST